MKTFSFFLFLAILIFAPVAFGTVEQWSLATMEIGIVLAFLAFCSDLVRSSEKILDMPGILPLLLLVCWMVVQSIPLPAMLVKILSPEAYRSYAPLFPLQKGSPWIPLSVYQKGTIQEALRITSYTCFYFLTVQLLGNGKQLTRTVKVCCWLAVGIAVVGILQKFSSPDKIYWFRSVTSNAHPAGPWVNRSQFCGYIEMTAPLALGLFLYYRPFVDRQESLRMRVVSFFSMAGGNLHLLMGIGTALLFVSVLVSLCRGGIIALSLSVLLFFLMWSRKRSRYANLSVIGIMVFSILVFTWFGWNPLIERFQSITNGRGEFDIGRLPIWKDSLRIFKDYWLTGSGFGTFAHAWPKYKTTAGNLLYDHAHNDYLELLAEGGLVGFGLAAWFVVTVLGEGWNKIRRRRDRYSILIGIGSFAGILAMLFHSVSDFNMQNGADGLYFFFLCGLLVSAGNTRIHFQTEPTLLKKRAWPSGWTLLPLGVVLLLVLFRVQGGELLARRQFESVKDIYLSRQLETTYLLQVSNAMKRAVRLDPFDGLYPTLRGDVERYLGHPDNALDWYIRAGMLSPLDGEGLQRIGLMLPKEKFNFADVLMESGSRRTIRKAELILTRAEWLLAGGRQVEAMEVLRNAMKRDHKLVIPAEPLLSNSRLTREQIASILPKAVSSWIDYGMFLAKSGDLAGAEYFYDQAYAFLPEEKSFKSDWFAEPFSFYRARKETRKALNALRLGIAKLPDYAPFHIWLGDYYATENILYRAREEYQQALLLDPGNESVKSRIDRLPRMDTRE